MTVPLFSRRGSHGATHGPETWELLGGTEENNVSLTSGLETEKTELVARPETSVNVLVNIMVKQARQRRELHFAKRTLVFVAVDG